MESLEVAMAVEVQHLVNQKLPDTTRMTMEENMKVKARFNQLSEEVVVLMGENTALRASKGQLSVNVDTLEKMLSEVSRQNGMRKKVGGKKSQLCFCSLQSYTNTFFCKEKKCKFSEISHNQPPTGSIFTRARDSLSHPLSFSCEERWK